MIFNINKCRDSNLGTKLEKTPTPQGLEQPANPPGKPHGNPQAVSRWGGSGDKLTAAL